MMDIGRALEGKTTFWTSWIFGNWSESVINGVEFTWLHIARSNVCPQCSHSLNLESYNLLKLSETAASQFSTHHTIWLEWLDVHYFLPMQVQYHHPHDVAAQMLISYHALGFLCGNLFLSVGKQLYNLGLQIYLHHQQMLLADYSQCNAAGGCLYSDLTIDLLIEYKASLMQICKSYANTLVCIWCSWIAENLFWHQCKADLVPSTRH